MAEMRAPNGAIVRAAEGAIPALLAAGFTRAAEPAPEPKAEPAAKAARPKAGKARK